MSQLTGSKLTEAEAAYLEKYGRDTSRSARHLDPDNSSLARIVSILCAFHPGNPYYDIPVLDVAALCRIYEISFIDSLESVAHTFAAINAAISKRMVERHSPPPPEPWKQ